LDQYLYSAKIQPVGAARFRLYTSRGHGTYKEKHGRRKRPTRSNDKGPQGLQRGWRAADFLESPYPFEIVQISDRGEIPHQSTSSTMSTAWFDEQPLLRLTEPSKPFPFYSGHSRGRWEATPCHRNRGVQ